MKTLVVYSTKSGASRECAELLCKVLKDYSLCDLSKQVPDIESFEIVILGSGVRMGKIYKPMRSFLEKNQKALLLKKTAFFLCNSYPDTFQKAVEKNIPKELIENAVCIESLGGFLPFTAPKGREWLSLDKLSRLVQAVEKIETLDGEESNGKKR